MSDLEKKIRGFAELRDNWDSYKGERISQDVIERAVALLPWLVEKFREEVLWANPTSDGGIDFEFVTAYYDVLISVKPVVK